ncbi:MAG: seg [Parcubacteria group bacterium]|nr:seg [Parcubacteria group bacterium]
MPSNLKTFFLVLLVSLSVLSFGPKTHVAKAAIEYSLLAPLPLSQTTDAGNVNNSTTPEQYIRGIVNLAIAAAGVIAVLELVKAGFLYATVESFTGKSSAKNDITNALMGLFLAIAAFTILQTISTQFTKLTISPDNLGTDKALTGADVCVGTVVDGTCVPPSGTGPDGSVNTCDKTKTCNYDQPGEKGGWGPLTSGTSLFGIPLKQDCTSFDGSTANPAGFQCQVSNQGFFNGLLALTSTMPQKSWYVTEAWPPTYKQHVSSCHNPGVNAGGCIDAAVNHNGTAPPTVAQIKEFLDALQQVKDHANVQGGIGSFQYEVAVTDAGVSCTSVTDPACVKRVDAINAATGGKYKVGINTNATGDHAHINAVGINDSD